MTSSDANVKGIIISRPNQSLSFNNSTPEMLLKQQNLNQCEVLTHKGNTCDCVGAKTLNYTLKPTQEKYLFININKTKVQSESLTVSVSGCYCL